MESRELDSAASDCDQQCEMSLFIPRKAGTF